MQALIDRFVVLVTSFKFNFFRVAGYGHVSRIFVTKGEQVCFLKDGSPRSALSPEVCFTQKCALPRSMLSPEMCSPQKCAFSRSVLYPEVCFLQKCALPRSVLSPEVC